MLITALATIGAPISPSTAAESSFAQEYEVKAAFLVHFADFVEWPSGVLPDGEGKIRIGVIGNDPFGKTLDAIVSTKNAQTERYQVRRYQDIDDMEPCQILFVASSDEPRVRAVLEAMANRATLTVGETHAFCQLGGMIHFFVEEERVRFEINEKAVAQAKLKISSKLLRLQKKDKR